MKKVIKNSGITKRLLALAIAFTMLFAAIGCGKKKGTTSDKAAPAATESVNPEGTPTPEPTLSPEEAKANELKRIEQAGKDYYKRLSAIPGYPNDEAKVLDMVKRYNGQYNLEGVETDIDFSNYIGQSMDFLMDFENVILYNDGIEIDPKVNFNPESYRLFLDSAVGKDTLKIVEELGTKVLTSRKSDRKAFEENAKQFLSLIGRIYFSTTSEKVNWEGTTIPDFEDMNMYIELILRSHATAYLTIIANDSLGKTLAASDNDCYTAAKLLKALWGGPSCEEVSIIALNSSQEILDDVMNAKDHSKSSIVPTYTPAPIN